MNQSRFRPKVHGIYTHRFTRQERSWFKNLVAYLDACYPGKGPAFDLLAFVIIQFLRACDKVHVDAMERLDSVIRRHLKDLGRPREPVEQKGKGPSDLGNWAVEILDMAEARNENDPS